MLWGVDILNEMNRLRKEMNGIFSNYGHANGTAATFPLLNAYEDKDNVLVTAELPGLTKDQVNITFSDGVLTLSGKQEIPEKLKEMGVIRKERSEGDFEKTLRIPMKVNQESISASFSNGILSITLPKAEEAKPKTISIEAK
ncbi:MAG: Hsp20/alpha crystallin family protein [Chitinispirillia bacterium]|jgi:HSP20 family protein